MKKPSLLLLLSLVFTLFVTFSHQAQTYNLKYSYQKGQTYKYNHEVTGDITQQVMGQEMKMNNSGNYTTKFVVDDIDKNGNMVLITSLDSGSVKVSSPMLNKSVDLKEFANKRAKSYVNSSGKIIKNEILDTLSGGLETFGITQNRLVSLAKLPENQIKSGENYTVTDTDTLAMMGGEMVNLMNITYKLAGQESKLGHKCLKLTYTGDMKNTGKTKMQGMDFFIEGTGKITGTLYFDAGKGILVANESQLNNDMTLAMSGEQSMIIPMTQSFKVNQTLLKN